MHLPHAVGPSTHEVRGAIDPYLVMSRATWDKDAP